MQPRVSVLIPTYNRPHFFEKALKSVLKQTYPHLEIIICDNSDNQQTKQIVKKYQKLSNTQIKYVRNPKNIGPIANQQQCFTLSTGEYINYLMDDDLFHPQKIEKMLPYLVNDGGVALVTSNKHKIDAGGHVLKTSTFFKEDRVYSGIKLGNEMLKRRKNRIGEPTTVLFRRRYLTEPFGVFAGKQAQHSVDMATWLTLLTNGKAVCLTEPLSFQRYHPQQLTNSPKSRNLLHLDWQNFLKDASKKGFSIKQTSKRKPVS